jgi:NADH:ubiquinone oxidoreductase subunit 4 (subunit M)
MLKLLLIFPICGIILINLFRSHTFFIALSISLIQWIHFTLIYLIFDSTNLAVPSLTGTPLTFQFQDLLFGYLIGIDGISLWFLWLIQLLFPILILFSWNNPDIKEEMIPFY